MSRYSKLSLCNWLVEPGPRESDPTRAKADRVRCQHDILCGERAILARPLFPRRRRDDNQSRRSVEYVEGGVGQGGAIMVQWRASGH